MDVKPIRLGETSWRLGVVGLGVAGSAVIREAQATAPWVRVTRGADVDPVSRRRWDSEGISVTHSVEDLCASEDVDVVYVASPTVEHRLHAEIALRHDKHVMIEKPIAVSVQESNVLARLSKETGLAVLSVHTPSFEPALRTIRSVIDAGTVGAVLHVLNVKYVPWLDRPRSASELDPSCGGGVVLRQAPHQVETAYFLAGAAPSRVYAAISGRDRGSDIEGLYNAHIEFANGALATVVFNGCGFYDSSALTEGVGEDGYVRLPGAGARLRRLVGASKEDMRSGALKGVEWGYEGRAMRFPSANGWTLVSCERGDLLQSRAGIIVYGVDDARVVPYLPSRGALAEAFKELEDWICGYSPLIHDAMWGGTVVSVIEAMKSSSQRGEPVSLG